MVDIPTLPEWDLVEMYQDSDGPLNSGLVVWQKEPGATDDDAGEPVCLLYHDMGSHYERLINDERNGLLIAAAPQLLQALLEMIRKFHGPSKSMGLDYTEAVGKAFAAARLTLNAEEQAAELDSLAASINGELQ